MATAPREDTCIPIVPQQAQPNVLPVPPLLDAFRCAPLPVDDRPMLPDEVIPLLPDDDVPVLPGAAAQQAQPQARGQASNRQGGYDCDFVQPPPEAVQSECPICHLVLREPYQASCCGNSFCRTCIEPLRLSNANCPTCRDSGFTTFRDKRLERSLNPLKVFCSQRGTGCEWKGELDMLEKHLNDTPTPSERLVGCICAEVNCVHCAQPFRRRVLDAHEKIECQLRPYSCDHCGEFESSFKDVVDNHHPVCKRYPLPCPNQCNEFPEAGIERRDLEHHVKEECLLTVAECDFHYAGCEVRLLRKDIASHLAESLVTHMSLMAARAAEAQTSSMKMATETQKALIEKDILIEQLRNEQTKQVEEIRKLKREIESLSGKLELHSHLCTPPITFTMTNFAKHMKDGDVWLSPPFYTQPHGHKLCIQIQCKHIIYPLIMVNVRKMDGEFDDHLEPIDNTTVSIQVQNVSQPFAKHINFTMGFSTNNEAFGVLQLKSPGLRLQSQLPRKTELSEGLEVDLVLGRVRSTILRPGRKYKSESSYISVHDCITFKVTSIESHV